jgi:hypothetical protein
MGSSPSILDNGTYRFAGISSRRGDSNPGPHHYERNRRVGRAGKRGHLRASFPCKSGPSASPSGRACPGVDRLVYPSRTLGAVMTSPEHAAAKTYWSFDSLVIAISPVKSLLTMEDSPHRFPASMPSSLPALPPPRSSLDNPGSSLDNPRSSLDNPRISLICPQNLSPRSFVEASSCSFLGGEPSRV